MVSAIHLTIASALVRFEMAAIARVISRATGVEIDVDTLRPVLIFCGAGLLFSLLLTICGVGLGANPF
jgi:hypothetical protein